MFRCVTIDFVEHGHGHCLESVPFSMYYVCMIDVFLSRTRNASGQVKCHDVGPGDDEYKQWSFNATVGG